ncbi:MAG: amidase family protein, partial [Patescibacteria group bacterium]
SGGTAAAVADNLCIFGIGEDTGGSIRQPASLCGIFGLRPTYGRNSRYGIMPMASSLDTVGPLAKSAEDIAILMEVMAGVDKLDATSLPDNVPNYSAEINKSIKGMKIGIPKEYFEMEGMDAETKEIVENRIKDLESLGCQLQSISLPHTKYAIPVYYIVVPSEDSSNLGRIDAIRYGVRDSEQSLFDTYAVSRSQGFPDEVKRRIMIGTYALSAGYYDAYYKKAQKVRTLIIQDFNSVFAEVDAIATPTSPFPAFDLNSKKDDVLSMYLADVFVSPSSLAGLPGLSIPAGKTRSGLPVGLQIIGPALGESTLFRIGHQLENNT